MKKRVAVGRGRGEGGDRSANESPLKSAPPMFTTKARHIRANLLWLTRSWPTHKATEPILARPPCRHIHATLTPVGADGIVGGLCHGPPRARGNQWMGGHSPQASDLESAAALWEFGKCFVISSYCHVLSSRSMSKPLCYEAARVGKPTCSRRYTRTTLGASQGGDPHCPLADRPASAPSATLTARRHPHPPPLRTRGPARPVGTSRSTRRPPCGS